MALGLTVGSLVDPLTGRRWNSSETSREIACRVARLESCGAKPGDRVFLPFGNRLEFFAELLAIWRLGACAVPIDARLTPFEIENLVRVANPRVSVLDDTTPPQLQQVLSGTGGGVVETTEVGTTESDIDRTRLDDDALILFTSGSTGEPKGVVHTHRSLQARWISLRDHLPISAFARSLCLLPTHFGHGLICNCLFPWLSGNDLIIAPPFRPDLITRLGAIIDENEITFLSSVPSMWKLATKLAKSPSRGTVRRVHCGSAPLSATAWEDIRNWSNCRQVCNSYGITETGSWLAGLSDASGPAEDGLIGEAWGGTIETLHCRDTSQPLDHDKRCAIGESGYVWVNTPALMKGYFRRDDLTVSVVRDGWFMTGDIGAIDERGRLFLHGRERDEINKGGMKIYPSDIDAVVERFPFTADVCAFPIDDPVYGQTPGMAVALTDTKPRTICELHAWITSHLAEHKLPSRWWIVEEIPRTSRGKINRDAVRAICQKRAPLDLPSILLRQGQDE